jgi:two-component system nitrate/nitrite response regulator NarL
VASRSAGAPAVREASTTVPRALIVDDNEQFLASARRLLDAGGVTVVAVTTGGKEAVRLSRELQPEIALVDVELGGASGFDVAASLAALEPGPVVVLISTHDQDELSEALASSPAAGFIPKSRLDAAAVTAFLE